MIETPDSRQDRQPYPGSIVLRGEHAHGGAGWRSYRQPAAIITTHRTSEVMAALREIETAVAHGYHAAGFLAYEAAPAFDDVFRVHQSTTIPLLWFGLYDQVEYCAAPGDPQNRPPPLPWTPSVHEADYRAAIARIKDFIAAGDTYQVNYTLRLCAAFQGDPWAMFQALCLAQRAQYCAYVDTGDHVICSASPELFFRLSGAEITCRPMKGTAARGLTWQADAAQARWLHQSEKNRAENVMIVDMVRNDLGRIARVGSVAVPRLFEVERYETLLQMTSTVTASTDAPISEIFTALFPCASITGAPKVRTMEIINELEPTPRGIYTGCIGYIDPGKAAQFNVAIRTIHIDRTTQCAVYGTGGGIVWDSTAQAEYEECRTKAQVLFSRRPSFRLLETLLWKPGQGYFLLDRHLRRLTDSACYFEFALDTDRVRRHLHETAATFAAQRYRVRLLVAEDGAITTDVTPLTRNLRRTPWKVALASHPVNTANCFLYHKTTHREIYESARAEHPDCDDVLLWNADGMLTESTIANVVVKRHGQLITPPVACGLLPGTYREYLLAKGKISEGLLPLDTLADTDALYLINSVRGWIPVSLESRQARS